MLLLAEICASVDFITKSIVANSPYGSVLFKLTNQVYICHISNTGISFGMLFAYPLFSKIIEGAAIAIVIYFILYYYDKITKTMASFIGMILGGGLSNFFEKMFYGKVTDFIHIYSWPVFNVADSSITIGVVGIIVVLIVSEIKNSQKVATL